MKIIDHTPFYNPDTGQISLIDRGKAAMKFGPGWLKEMEGQKEVAAVLGKVLDRSYTLLRNVTLPGLGTSFPFIVVGPAGVFVMYVTALSGMYRAKGDQWGTISGNNFKPEKINLLTRTERMARVVQVYLQRQGITELFSSEAILLCSDPSIHVDSVRPIIRVIMRDALERFAISIMQARPVFKLEAVREIIARIIDPSKTASPTPPVVPAAAEQAALAAELAEDQFTPVSAPSTSPTESQAPAWNDGATTLPIAQAPLRPRRRRSRGLNKRQWLLTIIMFSLWGLLVTVFLFLVARDQLSYLLSLLP